MRAEPALCQTPAMPASLIAACRTPWAVRHGALDGVRPEVLLGTAMAAAVEAAGSDLPDRVLVACDEPVGAQDHNIGRRVALELGWAKVPALTLDGHGATGLAAVALAAELPGRTLVASVDATSLIPPGAGLVRDYGRPQRSEPDIHRIDHLLREAAIDVGILDALAMSMRVPSRVTPTLAPVVRPGGPVIEDDHDQRPFDPELSPLVPDGILTAFHVAEYADGAAAVVVDAAGGGRPIDARLVAGATGPAPTSGTSTEFQVMTDAGTAALARLGPDDFDMAVAGPLALGSAPSGDGLRLLVDAAAATSETVTVVERGGHDQRAHVTLGRR